jgi:hypothetical protein
MATFGGQMVEEKTTPTPPPKGEDQAEASGFKGET